MKRLSLGALGLLLLVGCQSETFEERVARLRQGYTISPSGFVVKQTPPPPPAAGAIEGSTDGAAEAAGGTADDSAAATDPAADAPVGEAVEGEDGILVEDLMPVKQDVLLDLLVRNDNIRGSLPVLTLDITQVDAAGKEKAHWRAALGTSGIARGPGHQLAHELKNVDFSEGDQFEVEVRSPVPPEDRADYREFISE